MTIAKPNYDELSPDLRYKIWQQQNRGAIAKAGLLKGVRAIASKAYWIALTPLVLFVAVPQINDAVTGIQLVKQIWDLNPLTKAGKVELSELDAEQKQVASDIISAGKEMGASERDIKIALMTAQQESGMRNLKHGDDWFFLQKEGTKSPSTGAFQQGGDITASNPESQWGSLECRTNTKCSAKAFYKALLKDNDRNSKPLWQAAADVQLPDEQYRHKYAQWEDLSDRILASAKQSTPTKVFPIAGQTWGTAEKSSPYGERVHPITGIVTKHFGQDFAVVQGTSVVATEDGVASTKTSQAGCGIEAAITFADQTGARYCHLSEVMVTDGQKVKAGELIGKTGSTGASTGPHLHFERIKGGASVDPTEYLKN